MITITVLGSFHGHNAGDNAILASIVSGFKEKRPDVVFNVLSGRPWLLEGKFDVKTISTRPSNLSLNMLGLPAFWSIYHSDMVIITQAILFDMKLYNPAYNNLFALYILVPFAKLLKKPVICYDVGIGPLNTRIGRYLARSILNRVDHIILRQVGSRELLRQIGVTRPPVTIGADPALTNKPVTQEESRKIIRELGIKGDRIIGVNIHGYMDRFVETKKDKISKKEFVQTMSEFCDSMVETYGVRIIFIITTARYDEDLTFKVRNAMHYYDSTVVMSNKSYSHAQIMGVLGQLNLFVGMRLHSIILAAAMCTPVIGINYLPKVKDFMQRIGQETHCIEFKDFKNQILIQSVDKVWDKKEIIQEDLKAHVDELKKMVEESTNITLTYLYLQ